MDFEEEMRLRTLYGSYPDEVILEMLSQDPGSFREGAYYLLQSEARKRKIDRGTPQKPAPSIEQAMEEIVFVVIYAGDEAQVMDLRGTLEFEGIGTIMRDERSWVLDGHGRGGLIKLAVEKKDVERARRILEESSQ